MFKHLISQTNWSMFLWGFAEATLFFIVPDVGLSLLGIRSKRRALIATAFTTAGAILGGFVMYQWGAADLATVVPILERIPAISAEMITHVNDAIHNRPIIAVFSGPILGIPYKIYAAHAPQTISLPLFLLISIPARSTRFLLLAIGLPWGIGRHLPQLNQRCQTILLIVGWVAFYTLYFLIH